MMLTKWLVSLFLTVAVISASASATKQCNLYNVALGPLYTCALDWWKNTDLGEVAGNEVTITFSSIVEKLLAQFQISVADDINSELDGEIEAESKDPFAKIVESALIVEPSILFITADLVIAHGFTEAQLEYIGLAPELANKDYLKALMKQYMDLSCKSKYGLKSYVDCVKPKLNNICDENEDKHSVIITMLEKASTAYCDEENGNLGLLSEFTDDMGTVFKPVLDWLGFKIDFNNPEIVNYDNSIINNQDMLFKLTDFAVKRCSSFSSTIMDEVESPVYSSESSTLGAGRVIQTFKKGAVSFGNCMMRHLNKEYDDFIQAKVKKYINKILTRFDIGNISGAEVEVGSKKRHTVLAFGDPHIIYYNADSAEPVTCAALGWQVYVKNDYFTLRGLSTEAAEGSKGTYITAMDLTFVTDDGESVEWESSAKAAFTAHLKHKGNTKLTSVDVAGGVEVKELANGLLFRHKGSGTILLVSKFKETYYFVLRASEELMENSMGILITGCPDPISIKSRRRRDTECGNACSGVDSMYYDTCVFDCDTTGDKDVAEVSNGIVSIQEEAETEDDAILLDVNGPTTVPGTATTTGLSALGMCTSLLYLIVG